MDKRELEKLQQEIKNMSYTGELIRPTTPESYFPDELQPLDYTPEQRRKVFPLDDLDVPLNELILGAE